MSIEAMKQWLEALEKLTDTEQTYDALDLGDRAITSLRQAIEQAEKQEPVATLIEHLAFTDGIIRFYGVENMEQLPIGTAFYTTPQPPRKWVGFTDDEKKFAVWRDGSFGSGVLWADAQLKEKNK